MQVTIGAYDPELREQIIALSLRAWAPVFDGMKLAVPPFVYRSFYPNGWEDRQRTDVARFLDEEGERVRVAIANGRVLGWVGLRCHDEDRLGEIYMLAVEPGEQRKGIAQALIEHAEDTLRSAGMELVMVETGGDPGHAPARACYEKAGYDTWPVARYFRRL